MSHFQLIEEIVLLDVEFEVNFEFGKFLKKNDFFLDKNACLGLMGTLMEKGMLEEKEIGYKRNWYKKNEYNIKSIYFNIQNFHKLNMIMFIR